MTGNVFISYRREDTAGYAGRLYDRLKAAFPRRVFIDVGEIPPGADFAKAIEKHIEGCAALVALIGKNWGAGGRLQDSGDFVRLEIAGALKRDISVIPVLVGGAELPAAKTLPQDIQALVQRQKISISDEDWEGGCERLVRALQAVLGPTRKKSHTATRWGLALAAAAVLVVLIALFLKARNRQPAASAAQTTPANMPETTRAAADYDKSVAKGYDNAAKVMGDIANKIGGSNTSATQSRWQDYMVHTYQSGRVPIGYSCSTDVDCAEFSERNIRCYPGPPPTSMSFCTQLPGACALPGTWGEAYGAIVTDGGRSYKCIGEPRTERAHWVPVP